MLGVFLLIAGIIALGLYYMVAPIMLSTYRRYRGRRTIICPETDQIVEMELKAGHAGVMAVLGKQDLRVKWCSLWPGRKNCAQNAQKKIGRQPVNHASTTKLLLSVFNNNESRKISNSDIFRAKGAKVAKLVNYF